MDKISKVLKKLSPKERDRVRSVLLRLESGNTKGLDLKKLKGRDDIFRIRRGDIRIVYRISNKQIHVLTIERRNDTTYSF